MPIEEVILYIVGFLSLYTQVFFLLTFFTEKEKLIEHESLDTLHTPKGVTFLVPCWNEEKTVIGTVESLLNIDYPKDKFFIFIINDGSKDNTLQVVQEKYQNHPQVKIFDKENGGKHSALNHALPFVKTELFSTIDADTFIEPSGVRKMVAFFERNPRLSAVGGAVLIKNPKSIAQKAQSVEYQMFSFSKKMLGLLGGVLVVPGAFSLFRTKSVREIEGYGIGHGLEDLELTYRLQAKGYLVDHCHTAFAYTNGPGSVKSLFKQRLRWSYGFVQNTYDYRKIILNKKFGSFGMFTLPTSILSYFIILAVFFISWINIFGILFEKYTILKLVGFGQVFQSFGVDWFFVNTKAIALLSVLMFSGLLVFVYLGRKMSKVDDRKYGSFFWFFFLYSMVVPLWIIKTLYNTIFSRRPSWR